jgi:hypothetical protein
MCRRCCSSRLGHKHGTVWMIFPALYLPDTKNWRFRTAHGNEKGHTLRIDQGRQLFEFTTAFAQFVLQENLWCRLYTHICLE